MDYTAKFEPFFKLLKRKIRKIIRLLKYVSYLVNCNCMTFFDEKDQVFKKIRRINDECFIKFQKCKLFMAIYGDTF